jgi:hypothetical protein
VILIHTESIDVRATSHSAKFRLAAD